MKNKPFILFAPYITACLFAGWLSVQVSAAQKQQYKLVWSEEFNYTGKPDSSKWSFHLGDGCPQLCGWGNNEKQYYTQRPENVRVKDGSLIIEARKENYQGYGYTSSRLHTKYKAGWTYGRFEINAKLPSGKGIWSAGWLLPTNSPYGGWPHCGEIDIIENVGFMADSIFGTIHTGAYNGMKETQKSKSLQIKNLSDRFHRFSVEWTPTDISFYVDDQLYHVFKNENKGPETWPFDNPFYCILNLAVGGNWGGKMGIDESAFPQIMEVDYVRVYELVP